MTNQTYSFCEIMDLALHLGADSLYAGEAVQREAESETVRVGARDVPGDAQRVRVVLDKRLPPDMAVIVRTETEREMQMRTTELLATLNDHWWLFHNIVDHKDILASLPVRQTKILAVLKLEPRKTEDRLHCRQ